MRPARPWLAFFSAALATLVAVLALILPVGITSGAGRPAVETRVWAFSSAAQARVGADSLVSADQRLGEPDPCPFCASSACVAPEEFIDLYHGTSAEGAANIRSNGIDLGASRANRDFGPGFYTTRDPAQAAAWAENRGGESGVVLHYRVPASMFDNLSGKVFPGADGEYLDLVRSMRTGGPMHNFDYVQGPLLGNPQAFIAGKEAYTFGDQLSFHTQTAVDMLNGYLQP